MKSIGVAIKPLSGLSDVVSADQIQILAHPFLPGVFFHILCFSSKSNDEWPVFLKCGDAGNNVGILYQVQRDGIIAALFLEFIGRTIGCPVV